MHGLPIIYIKCWSLIWGLISDRYSILSQSSLYDPVDILLTLDFISIKNYLLIYTKTSTFPKWPEYNHGSQLKKLRE